MFNRISKRSRSSSGVWLLEDGIGCPLFGWKLSRLWDHCRTRIDLDRSMNFVSIERGRWFPWTSRFTAGVFGVSVGACPSLDRLTHAPVVHARRHAIRSLPSSSTAPVLPIPREETPIAPTSSPPWSVDRVSSLQLEKKLPSRDPCLSTGPSFPILGWTVPFSPFNASLSSLSTPRVRPGSTRKAVWAV